MVHGLELSTSSVEDGQVAVNRDQRRPLVQVQAGSFRLAERPDRVGVAIALNMDDAQVVEHDSAIDR